MAIEIFTLADGTDVKIDSEGYVTVSQEWLITGVTSEAAAIFQIPVHRYDHHPTYTTAIAKECSAKRKEGSDLTNYIVTVVWDSKPKSEGDKEHTDPADSDKTKPPTERPFVIEISGKTVETHLQGKDRTQPTNKDLVNTAGLPLINYPAVQDVHLLINISGYCAKTVDTFVKTATYFNTVNESTWDSWPAFSLKCNNYKFTSVYEGGDWFFKFMLELETNPFLWIPTKVANLSTHRFISNHQPLVALCDASGQPFKDPQRLSEDGTRILRPDEDTHMLSFTDYYTSDFANILIFP